MSGSKIPFIYLYPESRNDQSEPNIMTQNINEDFWCCRCFMNPRQFRELLNRSGTLAALAVAARVLKIL